MSLSLSLSLLNTPWLPTAFMLRPRPSSQTLRPPSCLAPAELSRHLLPFTRITYCSSTRPPKSLYRLCTGMLSHLARMLKGRAWFSRSGPAGPSLRSTPHPQPDSLCQNLREDGAEEGTEGAVEAGHEHHGEDHCPATPYRPDGEAHKGQKGCLGHLPCGGPGSLVPKALRFRGCPGTNVIQGL